MHSSLERGSRTKKDKNYTNISIRMTIFQTIAIHHRSEKSENLQNFEWPGKDQEEITKF